MSIETKELNDSIKFGPNSIWAKLQAKVATETALTKSVAHRGTFPESGTSLFVSGNDHSPVVESSKPEQKSKWAEIRDELAEKHQKYLMELDRLRKEARIPKFKYIIDKNFTPEIIRSLISRGLMLLQPEHIVLYFDTILEGLPQKYHEAIREDHKVKFCASPEFRNVMYQRLRSLGFIPISTSEDTSLKMAAKRYGLKTEPFNGASFTTEPTLREYDIRSRRQNKELLKRGFVTLVDHVNTSQNVSVINHLSIFLFNSNSRNYIKPYVLNDILIAIGDPTEQVESKTFPGRTSIISMGLTHDQYKRVIHAAKKGRIDVTKELREGNSPSFFADRGEVTDFLKLHPGYRKSHLATD